jgi:PEP-CTERM motif-containing protein
MDMVGRIARCVSLLAGAVACVLVAVTPAHALPTSLGDVFAAVGDGNVRHYSAAGALLETLHLPTATQRTTGMAFDAGGNLLATAFDQNFVAKFDSTGTFIGNFGSGYSTPEAIVIDKSGNVYVSSVGSIGIKKFDSVGNLLTTFIAGTRVDWMDLTADQTTMLFTQEGSAVRTVNVTTGVPGSNFAATSHAFALRILPDGTVLLADGANIKRFNASGTLIHTYTIAGSGLLFALNLDPDGTSFWSGDIDTGDITKLDITSGAVQETIHTGVPNQQPARALAGLLIAGEITVGGPPPPVSSVPEPSTLLLLGWGLAGLAIFAKRRVRRP